MAIDFGNGECDNIATVKKDGETAEIDLNNCHFKNRFKMQKRNFRRPKGWW